MSRRVQERRIKESRWTPAEATAWAAGLSNWTTRRFRVEGSPAGSSYLLSYSAAVATKHRYGGEIKEIIPSRAVGLARGLPRCPKCGAKKGKPCIFSTGRLRSPHLERVEAAEES